MSQVVPPSGAAGHPDSDDLATLAIGAMPELEAARLSAHISICGACARGYAGYAEVGTALAEALPQAIPRASLGARIMRSVEQDRAVGPTASPGREVATASPTEIATIEASKERDRRRYPWTVFSGLAAAAAVGAIAILGFTTIDARQDANDAEDRVQDLEDTLANGTLLSMSGTEIAPEAQVTVIVAADRETALITASGLPENEDGAYHLWLFHDGEPQRVSAFDIDEGETLRLALEGDLLASDAMAITLEEEELADEPQGPALVEGDVTA